MSAPGDRGPGDRGGGVASMTGHGVGEARIGDARLVIEIRSVNHRFLDLRTRLPPELGAQLGVVEARVRQRLTRGRVEVSGRLDGVVGPALDLSRARAAYRQLTQLRDELRPGEEVPLSLLAAVPDLFAPASLDHEAATAALEEATELACRGVVEMRAREGAALTADLLTHLARLEEEVAAIRGRVPEVVREQHERLRARLARLLADREVELDAGRLEHEIALLADRGDIAEELARLGSHADQLRQLLAGADPDVGRRLDFLLQEIGREINTLGSKSSDVELARRVIALKTCAARMREQAQNVL